MNNLVQVLKELNKAQDKLMKACSKKYKKGKFSKLHELYVKKYLKLHERERVLLKLLPFMNRYGIKKYLADSEEKYDGGVIK